MKSARPHPPTPERKGGLRTQRERWRFALVVAASLALTTGLVSPSIAAAEAPTDDAPPAGVVTWGHENAVETAGPIAGEDIRRSPFYEARISTAATGVDASDSFVYLNVPRNGEGKIGYDEQDGAEYAADAGFTMSWSSFEYATDVWVDVTLTTGATITSADQVTIRPTDLEWETELVDDTTIRVKVPYSSDGFRFSVEFEPELITSYNDLSGGSGALTTEADGNRKIHTEPKNAMLVFANPILSGEEAERLIPTEESGSIHRPEPGLVNDLNTVTEEIIYFEPGEYYMGSDYHAVLPANVRWVYLAPGAYVKGAFQFPDDSQPHYRVTGRGVLSGEQYVYEPDTQNGYEHSTGDNCHGTCVKMLQFQSSNAGQTLDLEGVTVAAPPYHSFVVYAHDDAGEIGVENFRMRVENYKQVGAWYWQTDGIELYPDGTMRNTFFHANDDVLKMYHDDVTVENTVIWKNENGPVIQWGWGPRTIDNVRVSNTDVIHNRMYWKDVKTNTCVFNSSSHWEDQGATDRADLSANVTNMVFTDTRVEGSVNCAVRILAQANTRNIEFDGLEIEAWNDLDPSSQVSLLSRHGDGSGEKVTIGDEMTDGEGILLHNYTVGGVPILKAGDNWASHELGRLDFDADAWESWNATSDDAPTGPAPTLAVDGLTDGDVVDARDVVLTGTTDAPRLTVRVNGTETEVPVTNGAFHADVRLPAIRNDVVVVATGENGVKSVVRRSATAFGTLVGEITDPVGDDNGPGGYTYPTDSAFNPGSFDLTSFRVYRDDDTVRFVTTTAGEVRNPWGGNGMSTQRITITLRDGTSTTTTPLLPGSNTSAAGGWSHVVVADGRYPDARFGAGVYGADLERVGDVALDVAREGTIVASVPASVLGGADLQNLGYQVSIFSGAEEGEGLGGVRPVYSADCGAGIGCPEFAGPYRFAGGAGVWTGDVETRDTDTTDSNAIDILSGTASQASVMDFSQGPVIAPYVQLDTAATVIAAEFGITSEREGRQHALTVTARNDSAVPLQISVRTFLGNLPLGTLRVGADKTYRINTYLPFLPAFSATLVATAPDGTSAEFRVRFPGASWR